MGITLKELASKRNQLFPLRVAFNEEESKYFHNRVFPLEVIHSA